MKSVIRARDLVIQFKVWENLPVRLNDLCDRLRLKVYEAPAHTIQGAFIHVENTKAVLLSNEVTREDQRYILAHEIGHYVLDHKPISFYGSRLDPKKEDQADQFARELLMPIRAVKGITNIASDLEEMSGIFRVRPHIMATRLYELGIPYEHLI